MPNATVRALYLAVLDQCERWRQSRCLATLQDKTKVGAYSSNRIMFKLVGVMLLIGVMIGSAYGGHGKTTIKPPDPTACSCSFSPAINTWVCSYDQACGGNGKGRSKNKLKLPKFNFKRWA